MEATQVRVERMSVADLRMHDYLLHKHHTQSQATLPDLDVDWDRYEVAESAGILLLLGLWDGDRLVGYSASVLDTLMHYRSVTACACDAFFVHEDYTNLGTTLVWRTEEEAKREGADRMTWTTCSDRMVGYLAARKYDRAYELMTKDL